MAFQQASLFIQGVHSGANFNFRGPRLFQIEGPSWRFATTDVIQISTARSRYIHWTVVPIHKHITLFWIPSISGTRDMSAALDIPDCHRRFKIQSL